LNAYRINLSPETVSLFIELLSSVFSSTLPFTLIHPGYRQFFFGHCPGSEAVSIASHLFHYVNVDVPNYPEALLRVLAKRLTSASPADRKYTKNAATNLSSSLSP
jgi:hypothetical protein